MIMRPEDSKVLPADDLHGASSISSPSLTFAFWGQSIQEKIQTRPNSFRETRYETRTELNCSVDINEGERHNYQILVFSY